MRPFQQITLTAPLRLWGFPRLLRWFPVFIIEAQPVDESLRVKIEEQIANMKSRDLAAVIVLPHPADWQPIKFGPFDTQIGTTWHNPDHVFSDNEKRLNTILCKLASHAFSDAKNVVFEVFHTPYPHIFNYLSDLSELTSHWGPRSIAKIFGEPTAINTNSGINFWTFYLGTAQLEALLKMCPQKQVSIFVDGSWHPFDEFQYPVSKPDLPPLPIFGSFKLPDEWLESHRQAMIQLQEELRKERLKKIRRSAARITLAQTLGACHRVKRRSAWRQWFSSWMQTPTNVAQLELNRLGIAVKTSSGRMADN